MRPRLLDLFCGAGGAAAGYARAGFDVIGVDIESQPRYPFEFHRADVMTADLDLIIASWDVVAVHASPPCQHYAAVTRWRGTSDGHPDHLPAVRSRLEATGLPWVIENVPGAPMRADYQLCGTQFGLPFRRHRLFETSWRGFSLWQGCQHRASDYSFDHGGKQPESVYRDVIGCGWMTVAESRQAIPPAYTERVGLMLMEYLAHENVRSSGVRTSVLRQGSLREALPGLAEVRTP